MFLCKEREILVAMEGDRKKFSYINWDFLRPER